MPSKAKEKASQKLAKAKGRVRRQLFASTLSWKPLTKCTCLRDQPRVSRNAWLRNNMRSDSTLRAELRGRMQAAHSAPIAGPPAAAAAKGESVSTTPRQPPPPPKPRPSRPPALWDLQSTPASSTDPPAKAKPAQDTSSSAGSSSEPTEGHTEATPWARRTARKTTSAKYAEHAQHKSLAPVEAAYREPVEMEAGSVSSISSEVLDTALQPPGQQEVGATPKDGFSLGEVASALQLASEEAPDPAVPPENPASPSKSETLAESAKSPSSPALVATSAQADQALLRQSAEAEVVDSTPPDSTTAADPGASGAEQPSLGSETLEVECREALRTKWLTFAYRPDECAAATLGRCRNEAAMSSLDTLSVWPDKGELDLTLSLAASLRPEERRLLATGPAQVPESSEASRKRKPVTSEDGLFCFACKQRAPSMEHMSGHFMTSAHVQAVKAYMAQ